MTEGLNTAGTSACIKRQIMEGEKKGERERKAKEKEREEGKVVASDGITKHTHSTKKRIKERKKKIEKTGDNERLK